MLDRFLETRQRIDDVRARLRDDIAALRDSLRRHDDAARKIDAIRSPYRPIVPFGGSDAYRTMLLRSMSADGATLTAVAPLLVPETIGPCRWHKARPNDRGGQTMSSEDIPLDEVLATVRDLYAEGVVAIGAMNDAMRQPCASCGADALLVCDHWLDYEYDRQRVTASRLCVACPRVDEVAYLECDERVPHPLLPPRATAGE